jgi:hypothetical protein
MLARAVSNDDEDTERTAQIFHSLRLSSSGGTSWGTTVAHAEGLGESDVASLSKRRDTKTLLGTQELILVGEVNIGDADHGVAIFAILGSPVETRVLRPIEVCNVTNLASQHSIMDSLEKILLIDLNGDERFDLASDKSIGEIITAHSGQIVHHASNFKVLRLECLGAVPGALQAISNFLGEKELETEKGDLGLIFVNKFLEAHLEALCGTILADCAHGGLHIALEHNEPVFNVTFAFHRLIKFNGLC